MKMIMVGMSELKNKFEVYLQLLKAGETIIVTRRGKPVAQIIPEPEATRNDLQSDMESERPAGECRKTNPGQRVV